MTTTTLSHLLTTPLHDWHVARGARMVAFGGWDMPVQYATGIVQEHLATRRRSGLFDVSHMGRFAIRGRDAERFLLGVLTNNARALQAGQAQYTFIANERGAAVDDAYLYKLAEDDFLLVVNAANREKDWHWLRQHATLAGADLIDRSDDLAMISLQGPESESILERLTDRADLPENKRNRLSVARLCGRPVVVARTGYTGETVCFEMFPESRHAPAVWDALVELGAVPVGLGARDSLRLEAGLPLYGHELGLDPDGGEIPIFANALAQFAVRTGGEHDYVGQAELERQRAEFIRLRRGETLPPPERRVLTRLIQPIAAFGHKRPLRAGFAVRYRGEAVGYVTSGTSVPCSRFEGRGVGAHPCGEHDLRPIGLALIDSTLGYRTDRPVILQVSDDRGHEIEVELVERNLWPAAPFPRPYLGFVPPPQPRRLTLDAIAERAGRLAGEAERNTRWRREECINLIPSEQPTSRWVDRLCTSDPAGRYNEHNRLKALGADAPDVRYYKGTAFIMEKEEELKAALRTFFDCTRVEARVISGQMANDTVYDGLVQYRNRHRAGRPAERLGRVLVHDLNKGGHLSAQIPGALKNYVALDPATGRPAVENFPYRRDHPHRIDVEATKALIARTRPDLLVFGRSVIIHREPVREIAEFVHREFGRDNPDRPVILYDAAHVLGLIGEHFQKPLAEGADLMTGSTHKTFFGPQRGLVLGNIEPGAPLEPLWEAIESRSFPGHVSNHHPGTLLGLLGATYEMLRFKDDYPRQVIANARAFARALHDAGLSVEGDPACGFTETHQVVLRVGRARGEYAADLLETSNVITNPQALYDDPSFAAASGVRMGTQEMTRHGMVEDDFRELAGLVAGILRDGTGQTEGVHRRAVIAFRRRFTAMRYCLGE